MSTKRRTHPIRSIESALKPYGYPVDDAGKPYFPADIPTHERAAVEPVPPRGSNVAQVAANAARAVRPEKAAS